MTGCSDMKKGEIYVCQECGLELQVVKECTEAETPADACGCQESEPSCTFSCCGQALVKKES